MSVAPESANGTPRSQDTPQISAVDEPAAGRPYCEACDIDDGTTRGRQELPLGSVLCDRCLDELIAGVEADRLDTLTRPDEVTADARAGRATVDRQRIRRNGTLPAKFTAALARARAAGDQTAAQLQDFLEVCAGQSDDFGRLLSLPRLITAFNTATGQSDSTAQRRRYAAVQAGWLTHSQHAHLGRRAIYLLAIPRRWRWRSPSPRHLTSITCNAENTYGVLSPASPSPRRESPANRPSVAGNAATTPRSDPDGWMGTEMRVRAAQTLLTVPDRGRARLNRAEKLALLPLVDQAIRHAGDHQVQQTLRGHLAGVHDVAAVLRWRLRRVFAEHLADEPPAPRPLRAVDETGQRWAAAQLTPEAIATNRRGAAAAAAALRGARRRLEAAPVTQAATPPPGAVTNGDRLARVYTRERATGHRTPHKGANSGGDVDVELAQRD